MKIGSKVLPLIELLIQRGINLFVRKLQCVELIVMLTRLHNGGSAYFVDNLWSRY